MEIDEDRGVRDIESPDVVDKYKAATEIANSTASSSLVRPRLIA